MSPRPTRHWRSAPVMQPGPGGGDPAIGDPRRRRRDDPAGETTLTHPPPGSRRPPLPPRVADTMSRHNRPRAEAAPRPPRPPRGTTRPMAVLNPHAAGIDVHSDMHMVCVPPGTVPPAVSDGGLPPNVRRF